MVEISVILPVYNAGEFLRECLDSLINQTFRDIEMLCINDGSSDNSLEILNEYAKKDERIIVVDQENMGVAKTRNNALKEVSGKFVYFMDSDDCLDLTALEKLHENITSNDSDFCIMKAMFVNQDGIQHEHNAFSLDDEFGDVDYSNFTFNHRQIKSHVLNDLFAPWFKLYRNEFLKSDSDFVYPESKSYSDTPFHVKTILKASKISFLPEHLYHYRYNSESLVHDPANTLNFFRISDIIEEFLKKNNFFDEYESEFNEFKADKLAYYMKFAESEEYYLKAKEELAKIDLSDVDEINRNRAEIILNSEDFSHAKLELELYNAQLRIEYLQESYDSLKSNYVEIKGKYNQMKGNYIEVKDKYSAMKGRYLKLKEDYKNKSDEYNKLVNSKSWKVTKPLRKLK
ncbi:glycosyltransferase [Methanobrevibacter sp.]|uniref:glycosyltransferase family 2 protein n=1 Tax=Methanobrevibacter sp. TaxID=66852 RepID=UPI0026DEB32C|nr:glycosyltransferase [Methanobrevibacter sp.]MDO5859894.1 glycosyltransferase [Methanobrevibacter sp.]